jgi:tetratricopeptide (TPR) repeat protein
MSQATRFRRLRKLSDSPYPALTILYGRRYLADHPDHGLAWLLVGKALVDLSRYEEGEQAFAKALESCPPDRRQYPLAQMGHLFRNSGDYDQAAEWYRRAIEADPVDAGYHIYLGIVLAKQGRLPQAEEVFREATQCVEGCLDEAQFNLGLVLCARERFAEAADRFREAIRIDPEYRDAHKALRDVEMCMKLGGGRA